MAGYAIQARVVSVRPRRTRSPGAPAAAGDRGRLEIGADADAVAAFVIDRAPRETRSERQARIRRTWSEMTFFLFDANSWR